MNVVYLAHFAINLSILREPWLRFLVEKGCNVVAMTPPGESTERFAEMGVRYVPYEMDRGSLNPIDGVQSVSRIRALLKELRPDVLHCFTAKPNQMGALASCGLNIPAVITTVTGRGSFYLEESLRASAVRLTMESLYRVSSRLADWVIFQKPDDYELFVGRHIVPRAKAVLIKGSGVDVNRFSPDAVSVETVHNYRQELGLEAHQVGVLLTARMIVHKGIREYISAAEAVRNTLGDRAKFFIAGDADSGNPSSVTRDEIERLKTENIVTLLGWRNDIRELLAATDIFVLPSYAEGTPRTVLEAMAMQKAIVTTDVPGCRQTVVHRHSGVLIPAKDATALTRELELLIVHSDVRKQYANAARERVVREFSTDVVLSQLWSLYQRLLQQPRS